MRSVPLFVVIELLLACKQIITVNTSPKLPINISPLLATVLIPVAVSDAFQRTVFGYDKFFFVAVL